MNFKMLLFVSTFFASVAYAAQESDAELTALLSAKKSTSPNEITIKRFCGAEVQENEELVEQIMTARIHHTAEGLHYSVIKVEGKPGTEDVGFFDARTTRLSDAQLIKSAMDLQARFLAECPEHAERVQELTERFLGELRCGRDKKAAAKSEGSEISTLSTSGSDKDEKKED